MRDFGFATYDWPDLEARTANAPVCLPLKELKTRQSKITNPKSEMLYSSRSITRGTLKQPAPGSGAFARASSCEKLECEASARRAAFSEPG